MKKVALTVAVLALGLAACEPKADENAADNVAVENEAAGDVNTAENAVDNALDDAGNALENAGEAVENAGEAVENAVENAG